MGQQARGSGCRKARKGKGKPRSEGEGPSRRTQRRNLKPERSAAAAGRQQQCRSAPVSNSADDALKAAQWTLHRALENWRRARERSTPHSTPLGSARLESAPASQRSREQRGALGLIAECRSGTPHAHSSSVEWSGVQSGVERNGESTKTLNRWTVIYRLLRRRRRRDETRAYDVF